MAEKIIYTIEVDSDDAVSSVNELNKSLDKVNNVKIDIDSGDIDNLSNKIDNIDDVSVKVDADTTDAVKGIKKLDDAMNAGVSNAESLASSQSRLAASQGDLNTTSSGVATQTGNLSREFNTNTTEAAANKESIDKVNISLESLSSTYDGVKPTNLDEFLNGTTEASKKLIAETRSLNDELEMLAKANVGFGATEQEYDAELKRVRVLNKTRIDALKSRQDSLGKTEKAINKNSASVESNTDAVTKNGGAIAVLDQLTGGWASQIKNVYEASKLQLSGIGEVGKAIKSNIVVTKLVTAAQWLWNTAVLANPFVALAVALVAVGTAIATYINYTTSAIKAAMQFTIATEDSIVAINNATSAASRNTEELAKNIAQQLALAKATGASTGQIRALEIQLLNSAIAQGLVNDKIADALVLDAEEELAAVRKSRRLGDASDEQVEAAEKALELAKTGYANQKELTIKSQDELIAARKRYEVEDTQDRTDRIKALLELSKSYIVKIEDIEDESDKERLARQKKRSIQELDEMRGSLTEKAEAKRNLIKYFALLEADLEDEISKQSLDRKDKEYVELAFRKETFTAGEIEDKQTSIKELIRINNEEGAANFQRLQTEVDNAKQGSQDKIDAQLRLSEFLNENYEKDVTLNRELGLQKVSDDEAVIEMQNRLALLNVANLDNASKLLGMIAGKSRALQVVALIGQSAAGIAKTVIDTQASNVAVIAQGAALAIPTAGKSVAIAAKLVTANKVAAALSIATNVAATAKGISALGGSGAPSASGGSGGTGVPSSPTFNVVGQSPASSRDVANNATSQIDSRDATPIKAYVVSTDVTSQQALDRKLEAGGSIG